MPPNYYLITLNSSKISDNNLSLNSALSFPGGSVVKNPPANAGEAGSIPGSGNPLEKKEMTSHRGILAWKFHGQRSLADCSQWGCKKSDAA